MVAWSIILPVMSILILLIMLNLLIKRGQRILALKKEKEELKLEVANWQQKYHQATLKNE